MSAKSESARDLALQGIPVIPLHSIEHGECTCGKKECGNAGKHPHYDKASLPDGLTSASCDPDVVGGWWGHWPEANIGLITGARSGIVVFDLDGNPGLEAARRLIGESNLGKTLVARTGNGYHLYYRYSGDWTPGNLTAIPGVHVRGDGNYVVAPPSDHVSGRKYSWVTSTRFREIPPVPAQFTQELAAAGGSRLAAEEWERRLYKGERDNELSRRAGKLLRDDVPANVVFRVLSEINQDLCVPPLADGDIERIVLSIQRKEQRKREVEQNKVESPKDFTTLTFSQALRKYGDHDLQWDVDEWLPSSTLGLVGAPPASFKTWILADLCVAIATKRPFLGRFPINDVGPVIFVQQEDFIPMLMDRIARIMGAGSPVIRDGMILLPTIDQSAPIHIHDQRKLDLEDPRSTSALRQKIKEVRPKMVLLDPLYSAVGMQDYMAAAAQKMLILKDFRDEFNCSFMIAHHTKKGNGDGRGRDSLWGSQFLNAWQESGWDMREMGHGRVKIERHFKVAANPPDITLQFRIPEDGYSVEVL